MVKRFGPFVSIFPLIDIRRTLYFGVSDASHTELWRSDGTEAGTGAIKQFPASVLNFSALSGTLYFGLSDASTYRTELWRSDGTEAGTGLVKQGFVSELKFIDFRRTLYFLGSDGLPGQPLWRSDGTEAGTSLVKRLPDHGGSELTAFKGNLYLSAARALWQATALGEERNSSGASSPPSR